MPLLTPNKVDRRVMRERSGASKYSKLSLYPLASATRTERTASPYNQNVANMRFNKSKKKQKATKEWLNTLANNGHS